LGEALDQQIADMRKVEDGKKAKTGSRPQNTKKAAPKTDESRKLQKDIKAFLSINSLVHPFHSASRI